MSCSTWNDAWVAALWDELDDEDARAHLAHCASCRATLDRLDEARRWLRAGEPEIATPAPARVVVLHAPGRRGRAGWAAAAAAALVLFASGLWIGGRMPDRSPVPAGRVAGATVPDSAWAARLRAFEQRLGTLESAAAPEPAPGATLAASVTRDELQSALGELERRLAVSRARDLEFVLGEIEATEMRAASWIDETRDGLRYVALASNPRLSER